MSVLGSILITVRARGRDREVLPVPPINALSLTGRAGGLVVHGMKQHPALEAFKTSCERLDSCASCHFPRTAGHRGRRAAGSGDPGADRRHRPGGTGLRLWV